jgi:outer membrane lipoprotein carrier protein
MSQRLHTISLTIDATGQIHSMRIEEADGAATTFTFTAMRENIPTSESDFIFTPPPGVVTIDGSAPI